MKKIALLLLCLPLFTDAQVLGLGKNAVKVNLSSLVLKNYSFSYERSITKRISLGLGFRTQPKGSAPFQNTLENIINSSDVNISRFQMGNTAWTPEVRFYLGKGNMRGFYIAPYARFATFDLTAPVKYTASPGGGAPAVTKEADFAGKIKSTSGGIMIGTQHRLFKVLVLDIWIIGGHYGTSKGDLNFSAPLNNDEQTALRQNLNKIDPSPFKFTYNVNGSGAQIASDGPWAGIRGAGINIGFHF